MTSRYHRGDAVTSTPEEEDFHFHSHTVVKRCLLEGFLHLPAVPRCFHLFRLNESHIKLRLGAGMVVIQWSRLLVWANLHTC